MRLFEGNQFGCALGNPKDVSFTVFDKGTSVFNAKALRRQVTMHFGKGPQADLLIYLPADSKKPSPLLLNIGSMANNQMVDDPGVKEGEIWSGEGKRVPAGKKSPFPKLDVMQFIERGYGFATIY
jgi:hypothetical protein